MNTDYSHHYCIVVLRNCIQGVHADRRLEMSETVTEKVNVGTYAIVTLGK